MASGRGGGMGAGQVVLVTFGFLIASFLVFVFGTWVGKDLAERRLAQEERVFRAPIVPPTAEPTRPEASSLAADPGRRTPTPAFQLPLARTSTPVVVPPTQTPTLTLYVVTPAAPPTSAMPPVPTPPPAFGPAPGGEEWADAGWTVQITATTDAAAAEAIAARLRSRGYDAYTVKAPARGELWHRVRVGRFATRSEAQEIEQRLRTVENLRDAFVTAR